MALALDAGIDVRTVLAREAERARGRVARTRMAATSEAVAGGDRLAYAVAEAGNYLPPLVRELTEVGEQTGHLAEVFARLADHYEQQLDLRRKFISTITWPLTELGLAAVIVGVLIWVTGLIQRMTGQKIDPLGAGLAGNRGLAIYGVVLAAVALIVAAAMTMVRRGMAGGNWIQRLVLKLPWLGGSLHTLALARLAWSMHLTLGAGMDVRRAIAVSLRSSRNVRLTDDAAAIDAELAQGNSIYEAFYAAGDYPADFLDAMSVGEQSGKLVESMGRLSEQYQQHARAALATLTRLAGYVVWVLIAAVIIAVIFRLASFYLGVLNNAMKM